MRILLLFLALALLLGPLRRPYLRHARFTFPATIGAIIGFAIGAFIAARAGLPSPLGGLLALVAAGALALHAGEAAKTWVDRVFGPKEKGRE